MHYFTLCAIIPIPLSLQAQTHAITARCSSPVLFAIIRVH